METEEGTAQGTPLSPLLSNIMLDDLDKELEKRGHKFVRYADDCNIYVQTRQAQEGEGGKSPWHMSKNPVINEALSNARMRNAGLKSLKNQYEELRIS